MVISQKCNCCMHEKICSQRDTYKDGCDDIIGSVKHFGCEINVHIKCPHFVVIEPKEKTITTNINKI